MSDKNANGFASTTFEVEEPWRKAILSIGFEGSRILAKSSIVTVDRSSTSKAVLNYSRISSFSSSGMSSCFS